MAEYGWSEEYILYELDGAKGWAAYNWALSNDANKHGCGLEIVERSGYIQKELKGLKDGTARKN